MNITYTSERNFKAKDLEELYLSVEWFSGNYPERLLKALNNCQTVFTAWDEGKLIGLVNALDDGELTAYVHYLLVNPNYQGTGVGRKLMEMIKEKYKDYLTLVLIAENQGVIDFYKKLDFKLEEDSSPMAIINK